MNPVRLATIAALCREVVLPAGVLALLVASGSAGMETTRAAPIIKHLAPSLAASAELAGKPKAIVVDDWQTMAAVSPPAIAPDQPQTATADKPRALADETRVEAADKSQSVPVGNADGATVGGPATEAATGATPDPHEAEPAATVALTDPSDKLPTEAPPLQPATAANPESGDVNGDVDTVEILDECYVAETCIDRYLWALYQRTPKEDAVKEEHSKKVSVKRKGKRVTVSRTFTTVIEEDFAWKDPKAADRAGMSMPDYVIGGMDQTFKLRLFRMLLAAEHAGLSPGITSAFRDDYRQSIASGLKAASDRSYHGGSFRGGYGHGLAADVVSIKGDTRAQRQASSEILWKWIDAHAQEFDIARPYRDRDPPHCGPLDGQEYADHNRPKKTQTAATGAGKHKHGDHGQAKRQKTARSSKGKST